MGTKLYLLCMSFFVSFISNNWMPTDWHILELQIYSLTLGACWGYNLWLLWAEQEEIIVVITTLYEFKKARK